MAQKTGFSIRRLDKRLVFAMLLLGLTIIALAMLLSGTIRSVVWPEGNNERVAAALSTRELAEILRTDVLPISKQEAESANASRPVDVAKLTPAKPFVLASAISAREASIGNPLRCLTQAVYYEAASESDAGQRAVAQVVLNRMRHPAFPNSVCGVVYQGWQLSTGCQFSFTCDGSLARIPSASGWARAQRTAAAALNGWVEPSVGLATHYHANYVVPYWADSLNKVKTIGAHIFYTMRGRQGELRSFTSRYDPRTDFVPTAPVAAIDPAEITDLDLLAGQAAEAATAAVPDPAPVLPAVREDMTGKLISPVPAKPSGSGTGSSGSVNADSHGKLLADERAGVLNER